MHQPKIRPFQWYSLLKELGNHQDLPHCHSSSVLFNLWTVPSQWNLVSYKVLFCNLLRYHVDMNLCFLCRPYVTRIHWTLDKNPQKTEMILWLLDRHCQQVRKMVITRIVSTNFFFRHCTHTWMKSHCVQTDMLAPNLGLEPVRLLSQNGHEDIWSECANRFMRVAWTRTMTVSLNTHSIRTSGRNCKYSHLHMRYIQSLTSLKPRETHAHRTQDVTAPSTPTTTPRRVGSLPQGHPGLWSTPVDPGRTPTVHRCLYGGRPWVARNKLNCFASNIRVRYLQSPFRSQSSSRDAAEIWVVISEPCTFSCRLMLTVAPPGEWAGWTQPSSRGATSQKRRNIYGLSSN